MRAEVVESGGFIGGIMFASIVVWIQKGGGSMILRVVLGLLLGGAAGLTVNWLIRRTGTTGM